MTTQTEALKLALEALKNGIAKPEEYSKAITAIKEALAQPEHEKERCVGCEACIDTACGRDECPKGWPKAAKPEQEPVAVLFEDGSIVKYEDLEFVPEKSCQRVQMLYTTPPQRTWVGLDDDDKKQIAKAANYNFEMTTGEYAERIGRLTEEKLKELNT